MPTPPPFDAVMHIDGGSRGNPGPAAYAVIVQAGDGTPVATLAKSLGRTTNNVAEYEALLAALDYALGRRYRRVKILSDSELLVRQIHGRYKVKSQDLKPLVEQARTMIGQLESFAIEHIPREKNVEADRLVNETLDAGEGKASPYSAPPGIVWSGAATYQSGTLKLDRKLPLAEGEKVEVEVRKRKS